MTMMGIIALSGIVVNNGVVLLDYTQLLIDRKKVERGLDDSEFVSDDEFDINPLVILIQSPILKIEL